MKLLLLLYYVLLYIIYGTAVRDATDDVVEDGEKAGAGLISGKHNGVPNALNVQVSICKNCMSIYR